MAKISWKAGTLLAPVPPAMISCGTVEKPNVMTVAWTGIIASEPAMTYVSIRPERYSHELIKESGEFVINITNLALVKAADYCGVKSGRDINKFQEMGLTAIACTEVKAPQIEQAPISIECKVKSITNYGTHDMFLAEIVAVNVDDKYIDEEGKLWLEKAGLVAFVHGSYFTLGRNLGKFGFSVEKNPPKTPKKDFVVKEDGEEEVNEASARQERRPQADRFANKDKRFARSDSPRRDDRRDGDYRPSRPRSDASGEERRGSYDGKPREKRVFDDRKPRRFSDDRPRREGESGGERRSYNNDGERRPSRPSGERSFSRDGERRPSRPSGERSFNRDGERRTSRPSGERSFNRDGERRTSRPEGERSFNRDGERRTSRPEGERSFNRDGERRNSRPEGERSFNRDGERRTSRPEGERSFNRDGERRNSHPSGERSFSRDGERRNSRPEGERSFNRDGENRGRSNDDKLKKFDGKKKFERAHHDNADAPRTPRKSYGKPKRSDD